MIRGFLGEATLPALPHDARLIGLLVAGICFGLVLFFKGFRVYREFRIEEDTPETPIRGMAMGLVHVHGEAQQGSEGAVLSPVGRTQCLFYKVDIDHWSGDGNRGSWRHWKTAWGGPLFALADSSGQVSVDAHGAQLMVGQNTQAVAGTRVGSAAVAVDDEPDPYAPPDPYDSSASSAENPQAVAVLGPPSDLDLIEFAEAAPGGGLGGANGYYRLTEYVVLPGSSYDVVGTYMDNPEPVEDLDRAAAVKDPSYTPPPDPAPGTATDRKLIAKGENERTFVISGDDEKTTQMELRHKAFLEVFGGAALAIGCLAILLMQFGLMH
jgi:hypothetical protein